MTLEFLPPCGATVALWSTLSGMTSIRVSLRLEKMENTKCYLMRNIENYTSLCTIEVDLSHLPLPPLSKPSGEGIYYHLDLDVILLFGLTELKAMVAWKESVSPVLVLLHPIFTTVVRVLNDGVKQKSYMILILRATAYKVSLSVTIMHR